VNAFRRLAQGAEELTLSLEDMIAAAAQSLGNLHTSFADARLEKKVERAGTPQEKADLLYTALTGVEYQLKNAEMLGLSSAQIEALTKKGMPVAYLAFEGEQHGFRRAENIIRSLEAELYFYGAVFGFEPADRIEPVSIANADALPTRARSPEPGA
jgi:hypothetical protein